MRNVTKPRIIYPDITRNKRVSREINNKRKDTDMAEHTLLRKLESLWGIPIFYADEAGGNIRSLGVFSEKQNPLTVSEELRRSLICQTKERMYRLFIRSLIKFISSVFRAVRISICQVRYVQKSSAMWKSISFIRNIICQRKKNVIRTK